MSIKLTVSSYLHIVFTTLSMFLFLHTDLVYSQPLDSNFPQTTPQVRMHIGLFGFMPSYSSSFKELPSIGMPEDARLFTDSKSSGKISGSFGLEFFSQNLVYSAFIGYSSITAQFVTTEPAQFASPNGGKVPGVIGHTLEGELNQLNLGLNIGYVFFNKMTVFGGADLYYVPRSLFSHSYYIISPTNVNLVTPPSEKAVNVPFSNRFSLHAGLRYTFPVSSRLSLEPSITIGRDITDMIQNGSLKMNSIRFGLSLKYSFIRNPETALQDFSPVGKDSVVKDTSVITTQPVAINKIAQNDTAKTVKAEQPLVEDSLEKNVVVFPHDSLVIVGIRAYSKHRTLQQIQAVQERIHIEEHVIPPNCLVADEVLSFIESLKMKPLLPSNNIRFPRTAGEYYDNFLFGIVTKMSDYHNSRLVIRGKKPDILKDFLCSYYDVEKQRIITENNDNLNELTFNGSDSILLAPIRIQRDTGIVTATSAITFKPEVFSGSDIKQWSVTIRNKDSVIDILRGAIVPDSLEWNIPGFYLQRNDTLSLTYTLEVTTESSLSAISPAGKIKIIPHISKQHQRKPHDHTRVITCIRGDTYNNTAILTVLKKTVHKGATVYIKSEHGVIPLVIEDFLNSYGSSITILRTTHPLFKNEVRSLHCGKEIVIVVEN